MEVEGLEDASKREVAVGKVGTSAASVQLLAPTPHTAHCLGSCPCVRVCMQTTQEVTRRTMYARAHVCLEAAGLSAVWMGTWKIAGDWSLCCALDGYSACLRPAQSGKQYIRSP